MKKILFVLLLMVTSVLYAQQTPTAFNIQGGYSWLNGVVGAELQYGKVALSGGWMPTKMPVSGDKISSFGVALTYYTRPAGQEGYSYYISGGVASSGYRYEYISSYGYRDETVTPITIIMVGYKYDAGGVNGKLGVGYGWCEEAGAWTFEATLGFTLFGN